MRKIILAISILSLTACYQADVPIITTSGEPTNTMNPDNEVSNLIDQVVNVPVITVEGNGHTVRSGVIEGTIYGQEQDLHITSIELGSNFIELISESENVTMYRIYFQGNDLLGSSHVALACQGRFYGNWNVDFNSQSVTISHEPISDGVRVHFEFAANTGDFFSGYFDILE